MKKKLGNPLVSVIIPCYNNAKTIQKCVESIEQQTYKNIEIIICDDCSKDDSIDIIKELVNKYNNIILLRNKTNMKSAYSRNRCIENSKGKYIAVQDADDISVCERIEKEVYFLENNPDFSYVTSDFSSFTDDNNIVINYYNNDVNKEILDKDFLVGLPFAHGSVLIKREVILKVNGYTVSPLTVRGQDYELFLKIHSEGYKGYKIKSILYLYRADQSAYRRRKYKYRINEYKVRKKYFNKMNMPWYYRFYILRPLIVGLIPANLMKKYHERKKI